MLTDDLASESSDLDSLNFLF